MPQKFIYLILKKKFDYIGICYEFWHPFFHTFYFLTQDRLCVVQRVKKTFNQKLRWEKHPNRVVVVVVVVVKLNYVCFVLFVGINEKNKNEIKKKKYVYLVVVVMMNANDDDANVYYVKKM